MRFYVPYFISCIFIFPFFSCKDQDLELPKSFKRQGKQSEWNRFYALVELLTKIDLARTFLKIILFWAFTFSTSFGLICLFFMSLSLLADRSNLSLNSVKKRQRTKKFAMTEGSWTGPEGPIGDYILWAFSLCIQINVLTAVNL